MLKVSGGKIVNSDCKPIYLKGMSLGGWLMMEGYMLGGDNIPDHIFKGKINLTDKGYILTKENMETNIEGVFAVGDVREKTLRQVATAVGDGAVAGVEAEKYIARLKK